MPFPTDPDALVGVLAAQQHGNFTRRQAHRSGLSNQQLAHRVDIGRLRRPHPSVFTFTAAPTSFRQRQMAACLAIEGAVSGFEAAAALAGFEPAPPPRIVVLAPFEATSRLDGVHLHRTRHLPRRHVTTVDGIPTTTPVRTIIDLAAVSGRARMSETLDWALSARVIRITNLVDEFNDLARPGRRGVRLLRPLIIERSDGVAVATSVLERRMTELIGMSGLPRPATQWSPPWGRSLIGRVDFAFPAERLVIEVDGRRWHTRDRDFETDRRRDQLAVVAGWQVLRFTWKQVTGAPDEVTATLREVLERRALDLRVLAAP